MDARSCKAALEDDISLLILKITEADQHNIARVHPHLAAAGTGLHQRDACNAPNSHAAAIGRRITI